MQHHAPRTAAPSADCKANRQPAALLCAATLVLALALGSPLGLSRAAASVRSTTATDAGPVAARVSGPDRDPLAVAASGPTLVATRSVRAGERADATLQVSPAPQSCVLVAINESSRMQLSQVTPTHTTVRWTWTVPANAGSASWELSASCSMTASGAVHTSVLRVRVRGHQKGPRVLARHVHAQQLGLVLAASKLAPAITTQPTSQSVGSHAEVTFSAAAAGTPTPTVQWQVSTDGGATWSNSRGLTDATESFSADASENGYEYRAVFTNVAGTATTAVATLTVLPGSSSSQSGYVAYAAPGGGFSAVSASWTVPTVTCSGGATTDAVQWAGIGDITSVAQDGTRTGCVDGSPDYSAWYEMYGDQAVNSGSLVSLSSSTYPVAPGDGMSASVSMSDSTWTLALSDATKNWHFSINIPSPTPALSQASAEWIVEDPAEGVSGASGSPVGGSLPLLSDFGTVQFTAATAAYNGQTAPISALSPDAIQITNGSQVTAAPGRLNATGDGFTDSWYPN
jgi:hypothetical protein